MPRKADDVLGEWEGKQPPEKPVVLQGGSARTCAELFCACCSLLSGYPPPLDVVDPAHTEDDSNQTPAMLLAGVDSQAQGCCHTQGSVERSDCCLQN